LQSDAADKSQLAASTVPSATVAIGGPPTETVSRTPRPVAVDRRNDA
jgi:hypothetical protein